jgi:two-component system, LuxR family, sensor kinase FixL
VKSLDVTQPKRRKQASSELSIGKSQKMQSDIQRFFAPPRWQLKEEIAESQEKFQYLIKYAPTGIYEVDAHDHFLSVNEAMCNALGYYESELLSIAPSNLMYPESKRRFHQRMLDAIAGDKVDESAEYHIKTKNGAGLWAVLNVLLIRKGTDVAGALVIVHDITERKRSERALLSAERQYRRLFETTQDGIMARDIAGNMINCNPAYAKMLGYTRKELRSIPVTQLVPEKWHAQREKIAKKVIETGRSIVFEREYRRKDGSIFPASVRTWRLTDGRGKVIGIWSIVREISLQKQQQRSLEEHAGILEQIVQDREKQLKDAERLVAIGQTAGMVGHDLRNPLQALTGELYLAKNDVATLPVGETRSNLEESIRVMEDQILYMDKIVSDLQAFVRPIHIDKKPFGLEELLSGVMQSVPIPAGVTVRLENNGGATQIRVDPQLLKRVLINLVTNAVQAMPNGGKLYMAAKVDSSGHVSIFVEDTGVGIPDRIRSQIFTPLFTTKPRGQGFGLAVCKRVIEAHGGTISFESVEGKGSRFTVEFPSA